MSSMRTGIGLLALAVCTALVTGCHAPASPSPADAVDVLDFLIGSPQTWPRVGSHSQNQVVDPAKREVCWVKYANPRRFECWRWDDAFVYHVVDHAIDGDSAESYRFDDGRWLPRRIAGDWRLDVTTRITWFDPACQVEAQRSGTFSYHQRAGWNRVVRWEEISDRDGCSFSNTRRTIRPAAPARRSTSISGRASAGSSGREPTRGPHLRGLAGRRGSLHRTSGAPDAIALDRFHSGR
jgi:hypothetical protein